MRSGEGIINISKLDETHWMNLSFDSTLHLNIRALNHLPGSAPIFIRLATLTVTFYSKQGKAVGTGRVISRDHRSIESCTK